MVDNGTLIWYSLFIGLGILLAFIFSALLVWNYRRQHALDVRQDLNMLVPGLSRNEYWKLYHKCKTKEGRQRVMDFVSTTVDGQKVVMEEDLPPFLRKDLSLCPYCQQKIASKYIIEALGDNYDEFEVFEFKCPHCRELIVCEIQGGFAVWDVRRANSV